MSLVSFYDTNSCIPVNQLGSDDDRKNARTYLYNTLGILDSLLHNSHVCEIGPGTGQNAIDLALRNPKSLTLVEPSIAGNKSCLEIINKYGVNNLVKLCNSTIEDFSSIKENRSKFDLVISEGLVGSSGYKNPSSLVSNISSLVAPGGILMIGCEDNASWLPEMLRRCVALVYLHSLKINISASANHCVRLLDDILKSSYARLKFANQRITKDIILDNILSPVLDQPFYGPRDIISLLSDFDLVSATPNFNIKPYYYKEAGSSRNFLRDMFLEGYNCHVLNIMNSDLTTHQVVSTSNFEIILSIVDQLTSSLKTISSQILAGHRPNSSDYLKASVHTKSLASKLVEFNFQYTDLINQIARGFSLAATSSPNNDDELAAEMLLLLRSTELASWFGMTQTTLCLQKTKN